MLLSAAGGLAALGGEEEKVKKKQTPFQRVRQDWNGNGNTFYNLDDEEERKQYFEDLRKQEKEDDGIFTILEERSTDRGRVQVTFQQDY